MANKIRLTMSLEPEVYRALAALATAEQRSLAQVSNELLRRAISEYQATEGSVFPVWRKPVPSLQYDIS